MAMRRMKAAAKGKGKGKSAMKSMRKMSMRKK